MTWRCGPDANWDPSSNDVTIFAMEITYNHSSYSFGILFDYSGACHPPPTGTPTATPPPHTTNHGPFTSQIPDEGQKPDIGGLIAGLVIFALVCAVLLALLLAAVLYMLLYKSGGIHRNTPYNDL